MPSLTSRISENNLLEKIGREINFEIKNAAALSGGDINEVYLLEDVLGEKRVVKINLAGKFPGMFAAEKTGLEALCRARCFDIPKAGQPGKIGDLAYLVLEYKQPAAKASNFNELFGQNLAYLHKNSAAKFGFKQDNYIGSLRQFNKARSSAADFYISQRLLPQLKLAVRKGFDIMPDQSFFRNLLNLVPNEPPALIHGDLWNGNYLVNANGEPCLIDPATAYAPREMDLAMMKLFGGFDEEIFEVYDSEFPLQPGFEERLKLWQLYYLLVHLNLFGSGYLSQVQQILKTYS